MPQDCQFDSENDEPADGTGVNDFQTKMEMIDWGRVIQKTEKDIDILIHAHMLLMLAKGCA